ncbi:MAG: patatin-like phospholipase family protein, partial [Alphaproteobacteria bacterium]|nr:patatin-like phospholipase family protein [Alphaproteobacteria bacterium]
MRTPPPPRLSTVQALAEELALLRPEARPPVADAAAYAAAAGRAELSALCLSGGGIRSAAFSLGVIQGLARRGLLDRFDYLSTVSGGGFIGGWLDALAHRAGVGAVQDMLRQETPPQQVRCLRDYTNYLTPRIGLLSLDTWAAAVLYLRNVLLNWLIFAPLFALCVLLAVFYRTLLGELTSSGAGLGALCVATIVLMLGTMRACLDLPSHRPRGPAPPPWPLRPLPPPWQARLLRLFAATPTAEGRDATDYASVRGISLFVVAPALIWAIVAPLTLVHWYHAGIGTGLALPVTYAAAMLGGYLLAAIWRWEWGLYGRNFGAWLLATLTSATVLWLGIRLGREVADTERPEMLAVVGPLWLIVASGLQALLHAGLRHGTRFGELDREWLARLSAAKLAPAVLWSAFAFCCLSLQRILWEADSRQVWFAAATSLVSGPAAAWLGKQGLTRVEALIQAPRPSDRMMALLLPALAVVFGAALLTSFGRVLQFVLGWLQLAIASWPCSVSGLAERLGAGNCISVPIGPPEAQTQRMLADRWYENAPIPLQFALFIVLAALLCVAARWIPVNRFSMHGVYRNRLTRAFLGTVRAGERRGDPFTTFDPDDNVRLAKLRPPPGARPVHVINATLNLTSGTRLAWAERKAASFTFTPLACGAADLAAMQDAGAEPPPGAFVPTATYAGDERESGRPDEGEGMTLATAMTLSGAAMSPN